MGKPVDKLEPPDTHYLNAAQGWLALGSPRDAREELAQISHPSRSHPQVIETLWQVCAAEKRWDDALEAAQRLIVVSPLSPDGWINQSYSLHELKRTREALEKLIPVAAQFAHIQTIPYNLACYECQLGNFARARQWLQRALKVGVKEEIKRMALNDKDLMPLWEELKGM